MSNSTVDLERIRRLFRIFGTTQCRGRSLVYEALSDKISRDDELLGLLLAAPPDQRRPSLMLACVNLLLASRRDSALATYYPIHGGRRAVDDQLFPAFKAFCAEHRDALGVLLRSRATQTNEIRRCVALRLGLAHVQKYWPGPFALAEIGASAGLNLLFDRYRYVLNGEESGATASPVVIACDVRGSALDTGHIGKTPSVLSRLGIDQNPIDLSNAEARAWLEAFIWPEQIDDLRVLRSAIGLAVASAEVGIVKGDATKDTARLLSNLPGSEPVIAFTASLLSYLTTDARNAFVAQLDLAARQRPIAWIFAEGPGLLATTGLRVAALSGPLAQRNTLYAVGASLRRRGRHDDQLLALADPYVRWLALARCATDDFRWVAD